jgi:hypothetical protein
MWPKVHVKTSQGDPARSNPRNHHKNAIKRSTTRTIAQGGRKKRPKKGQNTTTRRNQEKGES